MKTLQCPSCGASAQNHLNCEFCGSLFIRYQDLDIPLTNILSEKGELIDFVFPGLENELTKNLSMQKLNNWIVTDIIYPNGGFQVVASNGMEKMLQVDEIKIPSISIFVPFENDNSLERNKFLNLPECNLFKYSFEAGFHSYMVEFGTDAKGASYLVSKLLIRLYGINSDTNLTYDTTDYGYDDTKSAVNSTVYHDSEELKIVPQKGNCFIATATMGDYDNPVVIDLRNFRDNWILKQNWGKYFVNFYYKYGQYPAKFIEHSFWRKKISYYLIVRPLHMISKICK